MVTQSSLKNLLRQKPRWRHLPTKAIRIPECFLPEIEAYAISLDQEADANPPINLNFPIILGIKPSISQLGWSVLADNAPSPTLLDYGIIETDAKQPLPQRLGEIESDLRELIEEFHPTQVFIEKPFINPEYPLVMSKTFQVLGIINFAIHRHCGVFPTMIYPASWKSHLDSPKATKEDIAFILEQLFALESLKLNNAVDAIAIALGGSCGLGIEDFR